MSNKFKVTLEHPKSSEARDVFRLMKKFRKAYNKADKYGASMMSFKDIKKMLKIAETQDNKILLIKVNGENAGFVTITKNGHTIDTFFVESKFAGNGVATQVYDYLLHKTITTPNDNTIQVNGIHIDIDRVIERLDYWKSLGFTEFVKTGESLIYLVATGDEKVYLKYPLHYVHLDMMSLVTYKNSKAPY